METKCLQCGKPAKDRAHCSDACFRAHVYPKGDDAVTIPAVAIPRPPKAPAVKGPSDLKALRSSNPPDPYVQAVDEWGVTLSGQIQALTEELARTGKIARRASDSNLNQDADIARLDANVSSVKVEVEEVKRRLGPNAALSPQGVTVIATVLAAIVGALLKHFGLM